MPHDGEHVSDQTAWSIELPHTAAAVPIARALIRNVLQELDATDTDRDTAELLTSELVTNAITHTSGTDPVELRVQLVPTGFQVEVFDRDPHHPEGLTGPEIPPAPLLDETGRGLLLIRTLSTDAGWRRTPQGKAVWFILKKH
ncbi:ATP-binding protein [Streptomyces boninensis]|uniref:ATP-binding protein n=1 Tax=Streptomyces boninensis TaxID=2039455 RepID=UPI003B20FCA9